MPGRDAHTISCEKMFVHADKKPQWLSATLAHRLFFDILMRHGVVHLIRCNMVVKLDGGLPPELKTTYSDTERTQNTIYLWLNYDEPSGTVVNVRKSMWIHPIHHRALSVREAARLQTFPDSFVFCGTKDSQYQQVGNAVPPILAKALADHLSGYLDKVN